MSPSVWVLTRLFQRVSLPSISKSHHSSEVRSQNCPAESGRRVDADQATDEGVFTALEQSNNIWTHVVSVLLPEILHETYHSNQRYCFSFFKSICYCSRALLTLHLWTVKWSNNKHSWSINRINIQTSTPICLIVVSLTRSMLAWLQPRLFHNNTDPQWFNRHWCFNTSVEQTLGFGNVYNPSDGV